MVTLIYLSMQEGRLWPTGPTQPLSVLGIPSHLLLVLGTHRDVDDEGDDHDEDGVYDVQPLQ